MNVSFRSFQPAFGSAAEMRSRAQSIVCDRMSQNSIGCAHFNDNDSDHLALEAEQLSRMLKAETSPVLKKDIEDALRECNKQAAAIAAQRIYNTDTGVMEKEPQPIELPGAAPKGMHGCVGCKDYPGW